VGGRVGGVGVLGGAAGRGGGRWGAWEGGHGEVTGTPRFATSSSVSEARLREGTRMPSHLKITAGQVHVVRALAWSFGMPLTLQGAEFATERDWVAIFAAQLRVPFEKGELLLRRGAAPDFLCRLAAGEARVEVAGVDSPLKTVGRLGARDLFGVTSVLNLREEGAHASVVSESEGVAEVAPASFVRELCAQHPRLGGRLFGSLCVELARQLRALEAANQGMQCAFINFSDLRGGDAASTPTTPRSPSSSDKETAPLSSPGRAADAEFESSLPAFLGADANELIVSKFARVQIRYFQLWLQGSAYLSLSHFCFAYTAWRVGKNWRV